MADTDATLRIVISSAEAVQDARRVRQELRGMGTDAQQAQERIDRAAKVSTTSLRTTATGAQAAQSALNQVKQKARETEASAKALSVSLDGVKTRSVRAAAQLEKVASAALRTRDTTRSARVNVENLVASLGGLEGRSIRAAGRLRETGDALSRVSAEGERSRDALARLAARGLDRTRDALSRVSQTGARAVQALSNIEVHAVSLTKVFTSLSAATTALAAPGIAAGGITAVSVAATNAADDLGDLSDRTGVAVERLQRLRFVAGQLGVESGKLNEAFATLNQTISEFARGEGGSDARSALQRLGFDPAEISEFRGRVGDLFREIIQRTRELNSVSAQTGVFANLFSENTAQQLLSFTEVGRTRINELKRAADQLGLVVQESAIEKAERANEVFLAFWQTLKGKVIQAVADNADEIKALATQALAVLPDVIDKVVAASRSLIENFESVVRVSGQVAGGLVGGLVGSALPGIGTSIGAGLGILAGTLLPEAASALASFTSKTKQTQAAVNTLAGSSGSGGLASLTQRLEAAADQAKRANTELTKLAESRIEQAETRVERLEQKRVNVAERLANAQQQLNQARQNLAQQALAPDPSDVQARDRALDRVERLRGKLQELNNTLGSQKDKLRALKSATDDYKESTKEAADATEDLTALQKRFGETLDDQVSKVREQADAIERLERRERALAETRRGAPQRPDPSALPGGRGSARLEQIDLSTIDLEERAQAARLVEDALADVNDRADTTGDRFREVGIRINSMREIAVGALREVGSSIQTQLSDAFNDLFRGSLDGVKDFFSRLDDIFRRSLADIAATVASQRIVIPIATSVVGGTVSGVSSLFGGGDGASGGGGLGLGTLSDAASLGRNLGIGGSGGIAAGINSAASSLGLSATGTAPASGFVASGGGAVSGGAAPSTGFLGTGASAASVLGGIGVGFGAGSLLSSALGGGTSGTIGSGVGSAGGALIGSVVPGIGTLIGGLLGGLAGGGIGSLFGADAPDAELRLRTGQGQQGPLGRFRVGGEELGKVAGDDARSNFEKQIASFDKQVAQVLSERTKQIIRQNIAAVKGREIDVGKEFDKTETAGLLAERANQLIKSIGIPTDAAPQFIQDIRSREGGDFDKALSEQINKNPERVAQQTRQFFETFERTRDLFERLGESTTLVNSQIAKINENAEQLGNQALKRIKNFVENVQDFGFGSAEEARSRALNAVKRQLGIGDAGAGLSGAAAQVQRTIARAEALAPALREIGLSADEAASLIDQGISAQLDDFARQASLTEAELQNLTERFPEFSSQLERAARVTGLQIPDSEIAAANRRTQFPGLFTGEASIRDRLISRGVTNQKALRDFSRELQDLPDDARLGTEAAANFRRSLVNLADVTNTDAQPALRVLTNLLQENAQAANDAAQQFTDQQRASIRGRFSGIFGEQGIEGQITAAGLGGSNVASILRNLPDNLAAGSEAVANLGQQILDAASNAQNATAALEILSGALDDTASGAQERIDAQRKIVEARRTLIDQLRQEQDAARRTAEQFDGLARSLEQSRFAAKVGQNSPLSPQAQFQTAQAEFQRLASRAQNTELSDAARARAAERLPDVRSTLLDTAVQRFGATERFARIFQSTGGTIAQVRESVQTRADAARQTVDRLETQIQAQRDAINAIAETTDAINRLREPINSVEDAVNRVQQAISNAPSGTETGGPAQPSGGGSAPSGGGAGDPSSGGGSPSSGSIVSAASSPFGERSLRTPQGTVAVSAALADSDGPFPSGGVETPQGTIGPGALGNLSDSAIREIAAFQGIPGFADGGTIPGGQPAIVGERGPELIQPAQPVQVSSNRDTTGMVEELQALRQEVQRLRRQQARESEEAQEARLGIQDETARRRDDGMRKVG